MENSKKLFEQIVEKIKEVDRAWNFHTTNSVKDFSVIKTITDFRIDSGPINHLVLWLKLSETPKIYKISLFINVSPPLTLLGEFDYDDQSSAVRSIEFMEKHAVVEISFRPNGYEDTFVKLNCNGLSYEKMAKILIPIFSVGK